MTSTVRPGLVTLEFPIADVWRALPVAYDSIGIPVGKMDTLSRVVGNEGYKLRRKLGGVPLTRYLDCGQAQGFKSAETYEISLSVLTQLQPAGTGQTTAATVVQASAKPVNFAGEYSACESTGELEKRVADVRGFPSLMDIHPALRTACDSPQGLARHRRLNTRRLRRQL